MSTNIDGAKRDLWYLIAELRGYKIDVYPKGKDWAVKLTIDDDVVAMQSDHMDTEEFAHEAAMFHLPDWLHSVDEALSLPIDHEKWFWNLMPHNSHGHAQATLHPYDMSLENIRGYDDSGQLATAMCKAWAEMKRREEYGEPAKVESKGE